jgi:hypothetical protein
MSGFGTTPYGASPYGDAGGGGSSASTIDLADAGQVSSGTPDALLIPGLLAGAVLSDTIGDRFYFAVTEALSLSAVAVGELLPNLIDTLAAGGGIEHTILMSATAADGASATDGIAIAWQMAIAADLNLMADPELTVRQSLAIIDALVATGAADSRLTALADVAAALVLRDVIARGMSIDAVDAASFTDEVQSTALMLADLLDEVSCLSEAVAGIRLTAVVAAGAEADAGIEGLLRAIGDLEASALVYGTFRLGDDEYSGWVMNAPLKAFSTNTHLAFDSFATFDGMHLAAGPNGIARFTGRHTEDTAAGEAVDFALRTALMDFGTTRFKRMPDVFFGLSTDGRMFLKVITRDYKTGAAFEDWYELTRTKDGAGTARAELGRGLRSTWWQFELCNIGGAGIELDAIELRPMILDKRT